jgi:pectinesterase
MSKKLTICILILFFVQTTKKGIAGDQTMLAVSADGSGDFTSIQAAVDAGKGFPDGRVTIFIKKGIYREKIRIPACNTRMSMIGESAENTVIIWDDHFSKINRGRNSTFYTWTMMVEADDFYAENLTIENSSGLVGQAVALHVEGDRCSFRNCRILGHQDSLYAAGQKSRQYFTNCIITGTTDFIFGAATALFERCTIHSLSDSYITAASTPKGKPFGFVFRECKLTAAEGVTKVFLGRPWRDDAKTVFIKCEMGAHIHPERWSNWGGTQRDQTAYYAEYGNTGPGSSLNGKVGWSHILKKKQAAKYTRENILKAVFPHEPALLEWLSGE